MRGSPHAHCLLWVKDAPKMTKIQMMLFLLSLIKYITAVIPPVAPENEHDIKTDRQSTETYTF